MKFAFKIEKKTRPIYDVMEHWICIFSPISNSARSIFVRTLMNLHSSPCQRQQIDTDVEQCNLKCKIMEISGWHNMKIKSIGKRILCIFSFSFFLLYAIRYKLHISFSFIDFYSHPKSATLNSHILLLYVLYFPEIILFYHEVLMWVRLELFVLHPNF